MRPFNDIAPFSVGFETKKPYLVKATPSRRCETCGAVFERTRHASGKVQDRTAFLKRRFCSRSCASSVTRGGESRSNLNLQARRHLTIACECCGSGLQLVIHHANEDWRDNDPSNLQTLCEGCHRSWHSSQRHRGIKPAGRMPARDFSTLDTAKDWPVSTSALRNYVVTMRCRRGVFDFNVEAETPNIAIAEARKHFNRTRGLGTFTEKRTYSAKLALMIPQVCQQQQANAGQRAFNAIAPYSVGMVCHGGHEYALFRSGQIIESGFDCRGDAIGYAHDLLDAEEAAEEEEAAFARQVEAELRADAAAILAQIGEAA